MQYIGRINKKVIGIYKEKIITSDIILTNERLYGHILISHKKDYEEFQPYIEEVIKNPDYVIEDNKHNDTLIFLKEIEKLNKKCRIVVKLALGKDKEHPKNSIITMMKQNDRTWNQTIGNRGRILFDKYIDKLE